MRKKAHFQDKETLLENFIRKIRINKIKKLIPPKSSVLDVGCGYEGYFLQQIENSISFGVGLDIKVQNSTIKNIKLKSVNLLKKLPEKNSTFDVVIALAILEHLKYPQNTLCEAKRVLKPGGILIITTPHKITKPLLEFLAFKLEVISKEEIKDHKRYFDKSMLKNNLNEAGFNMNSLKLSTFMFGMNLLAIAKKD